MTDDNPIRARRRPLRLVLAVLGLVVLVAALAVYAARRVIAREVLTGWLQSRGIASEAEVEAFGLSGFTGRLRIGDPARPDFTAERAEVSYGLRGLSFEVRSVKLKGAVLRARLHDGRFSVGSLDPLVEEFRRRPPRPDQTQPRIDIDGGRLLLTTDYGRVDLTATARVEDSKLISLDGASMPATLTGRGFRVETGRGALALRTAGGRVRAGLDLPLAKAQAGSLVAEAAQLKLAAEAGYPDFKARRGDGAVVLNGALSGRRIALGDQGLADAVLTLAFRGQSAGWIPDLTVAGQGTAQLRAASAALPAARVGALQASLVADDVRWTRKGGDAVSARVRLSGEGADVAAGDLRLQSISATGRGVAAFDRRNGPSAALTLAAFGRGGWLGLGAPVQADGVQMAAIKRAARSFAVSAPAARLSLSGGGASFALTAPVQLRPDRGGLVILAPRGGGYLLTSAGGGLPDARAEVASFEMLPGGARASGRLRASLSVGPVEDGVIDARGVLRIADGRTRFDAAGCVPLKARKLELGENDVTDLSGQLCQGAQPLLTLANGGWRVRGAVRAARGALPVAQVRLSDGAGTIDFQGAGAAMSGRAHITDVLVADTAPALRFNPLRGGGDVQLARETWTGGLIVRSGATSVASVALRHDGRSGEGSASLDTGLLTFADGGLQPSQLSPLAAAVGSPAQGSARFTGAFAWTPAGVTSRGTLEVPRLDFESPAGRITGLSGKLAFTSLAPLVAAPGQTLHADTLSAIVPLTDITATFGIQDEALHVTGGQAVVGGGVVRVESLTVPFTPKATIEGVLDVDRVQLHDLVEASPFGDKVDLDAKVTGRIPFNTAGGAIHVLSGSLAAIQPGRLSIQREALTAVSGSGGGAMAEGVPAVAQPTNTFTDFAYQAMENLAFDTLSAELNSLPEGRLGILFKIKGRHDPPQRQEIRLTLLDLIQRRFMNRELPLPSGTKVDLTLDTTVNLDQLLNDYAEYQRLRSSAPVQP